MGFAQTIAGVHGLSILCQSSIEKSLFINVILLLVQIAFVYSMYLYLQDASKLERETGKKNKYRFLPLSILLGTLVSIVAFAVIVLCQVYVKYITRKNTKSE